VLPIKIEGLATNSKEVNPFKHAVSYYMYYLLELSKNAAFYLSAFVCFV
jgi:hypothetical protein